MTMENDKEIVHYVSFADAMKKLGQAKYISLFLNPDEKLREDGTPYIRNIRTEGDLDDYDNLKIHPDDVKLFIRQWLEYKQSTGSLFHLGKKLEDFQ